MPGKPLRPGVPPSSHLRRPTPTAAPRSPISFPLPPCRPIGYAIDSAPDKFYPKPTQTNCTISHKADLGSAQ